MIILSTGEDSWQSPLHPDDTQSDQPQSSNLYLVLSSTSWWGWMEGVIGINPKVTGWSLHFLFLEYSVQLGHLICCAQSLRSYLTLCNMLRTVVCQVLCPCSPGRILEWVVMLSSRWSSRPRVNSSFLCLLHWQRSSNFTVSVSREAPMCHSIQSRGSTGHSEIYRWAPRFCSNASNTLVFFGRVQGRIQRNLLYTSLKVDVEPFILLPGNRNWPIKVRWLADILGW